MSTLIELYDKEPILNIIAACAFRPEPENIVFLGSFTDTQWVRNMKAWVAGFLRDRGIKSDVHFVDVDTGDCSQIIETLFEIEKEYDDCVLEVSGGSDLSLLAAGMFAENADVPIFYFDVDAQCFADVRDMTSANNFAVPVFSAEEIFSLASAGVTGHGHFRRDSLDMSVRYDAREIWYIFLANRSKWHQIVIFFQNANYEDGNELVLNHNGVSKGLSAQERANVAKQLEAAGIIHNLSVKGNHIGFVFKNQLVKKVLTDAGAALEIFTYSCIKRNPDIFSDCEINICIDWDGDGPSETKNEIDVVAVSDAAPLFISCKSGKLDSDHLNELYTIRGRFGGILSKAVLMTADDSTSTQSGTLRQRARDMQIALIGLSDICPKIRDQEYRGITDCRTCFNRHCEKNLIDILADVLER